MERSRRDVLKLMGAAGALAFVRCGGSGTTGTLDGGVLDGSVLGDGAAATGDGAAASLDGALSSGSFATGSGAFFGSKDYGNPFSSGIGSACSAFPTAIDGPCHSNTYNRKDITDGLIGLPTRFDLLIVDGSCNPVSGAIVEVWYASPTGTYSQAAQAIEDGDGYDGSLSDLNKSFCTGNDADALASNWLRGYQTSGSDGRVILDGVFPGWYRGRTPHVHFKVTVGSTHYLTSQLIFDETLTTQVYTKHASYTAHGDKDTPNATDMVATQSNLGTAGVMSFAQQSDGAMLCYKAITISK